MLRVCFISGGLVSRACLADKDHFGPVTIFTRDASSDKAQALAKLGAKLSTDPITAQSLAGVDVFVSALPLMRSDPAAREANVQAAAEAGVKVYFPSEYGG